MGEHVVVELWTLGRRPQRGVDLAERQGHEGWFLPVPATFVVDRGGVVRWAFMDVDFTHRAEPDDILAALAAL